MFVWSVVSETPYEGFCDSTVLRFYEENPSFEAPINCETNSLSGQEADGFRLDCWTKVRVFGI